MIIGIDVDGVILDYMNLVRSYAELYDFEELHKNGVINRLGIKVKERYDWTEEEARNFANKYFDYLTSISDFKPLAIDIINKLHDEGNTIYIITNRGVLSEKAISLCKELFDKNNLKVDKYFWKIEDKVSVIKENNVDIMIDDSYKICKATSDNKIPTIYFREKGSQEINSTYIYDVDNWGEVYRVVKGMNN
jgi:uncharacterized HAD superfamily protein